MNFSQITQNEKNKLMSALETGIREYDLSQVSGEEVFAWILEKEEVGELCIIDQAEGDFGKFRKSGEGYRAVSFCVMEIKSGGTAVLYAPVRSNERDPIFGSWTLYKEERLVTDNITFVDNEIIKQHEVASN